jgi:hypothetical protein
VRPAEDLRLGRRGELFGEPFAHDGMRPGERVRGVNAGGGMREEFGQDGLSNYYGTIVTRWAKELKSRRNRWWSVSDDDFS